ncbi:hypothetical protein JCM8097_007148 [Rhodosporidiobolus ruineniae]
MASRPSRTTRSSVAATTAAPVTRSTRSSTATASSSGPSTSTTAPARRTTRVSRATTPQQQDIKLVPTRATRGSTLAPPPPPAATTTRASSARASSATAPAPRALWGARQQTARDTETPPPAAKRMSTLAVPGSTLKPRTPGLLGRIASRESLRPTAPKTPAAPAPGSQAAAVSAMEKYDGAREPIKAYLRIHPAPPGVAEQSYVQVLNETEVLMVPPLDHRLNPSSSSSSIYSNALLRNTSHQRLSILNLDPSSHPNGVPNDVLPSPAPTSNQLAQPDPASYGALYKFTGVFPTSPSPASPTSPLPPSSASPTTTPTEQAGLTQFSFFSHTALPLVRSFLQEGENCLLFAYGPTGSGKTFTVQGGEGDEAGLLPRIVEVVWGSLKGKEKPMTPTHASTSTLGRRTTSQPMQSTPVKPSLRGLGTKESLPMTDLPELIPVDDQYEYAIYVSYSEIYNEKIYDLLESPLPAPAPSTSSTTSTGGGSGMFKGLFKNFTTVKRSALSLKADKSASTAPAGAGRAKVVGGLREVRVSSAEEAHRVLHQGQSNRRVFSTLANRASSRSHSIFSIKLVRTLRSSPSAAPVVSKFSIVDLAGSERVASTQTTGERLKEAGNINKSLMVLGQCMEVLRKNQERGEGKKPAIVPFRHSKLTEMFQSFFIGEGKAVMIVNINPYSTSFDENSHVMKFSAVARGIMTVQRSGTAHALAPPVRREERIEEEGEEEEPRRREPVRRVVRMSLTEGGQEEEVVYEEEDLDEDDDGEEDEFVNALLDELSALRTALFESQLNTVLAVANERKRVAQEYEAKMLDLDQQHQMRLREEAIEAENKLNAKLDILTRLEAAKTPARRAILNRLASETPSTVYDDSDEEDSRIEEEEQDGEGEGESGEVERLLLTGARGDMSGIESASASPLAARIKVQVTASATQSGPRTSLSPIRGHAKRVPSPLAAAHAQPAAPAPEADSSFVPEADEEDAELSVVEHSRTSTDADLSRLTDQTADLSVVDGEEEADESIVDLRRFTEQHSAEGDVSVARNPLVDGEAEEDEEEELTELEEEEEGESVQQSRSELDDEEDAPEADDSAASEYDAGAATGSEDDFEPSPSRKPSSPAKKGTPASASYADADESFDTFSPVKTPAQGYGRASPSKKAAGSGSFGKENEAPLMSTPSGSQQDEDGDEDLEADEFGLDRSMVIRSGSKAKKSKRKLGSKKVVDADDLDTFAEGVLSPIRKTGSVRSFKHY